MSDPPLRGEPFHTGESFHTERLNFRTWVNRILQSLRAPTIKGLRICFDVYSNLDIDNWISFAIDKEAQSLELDLTDVDVSDQALDYFLTQCPSLEVLRLIKIASLTRFIASESLVNLKCLELRYCNFLKEVEISAINLTSLSYTGIKVAPVALKNLLRLVEVLFGGACLSRIYHTSQLQINLSQLETLGFDVFGTNLALPFLKTILKMSNVKHLELEVQIKHVSCSFLSVTSLLKAAPLLHTFTLKIMCCADWSSRELSKISLENPYPCLKVVKLYGFVGVPAEVEMIFHLRENSPLLEKLIIDPCQPFFLGSKAASMFRKSWDYKSAKLLAMELQAKIPQRIEFIVA
ncbi:PREDICTED: uncharacterized protein LOC18604372 [Theobroma cacao]|uniref:Uncharacterized protein LOC18604372 n=1 Tax=Theobroma cacao TaxID=3641 RepID=A0AB32W314_THECC|nr:PREDICTED: uncharacterized protein LOC18604372 [Theobroma cacao]